MPAVDAADHAVILLYHRIADTGSASTRVAPARFAAHLELIRDQGYQVIPLAELLDIAAASGEFPERALAISFDDAYRSVGEVAYPMLREHGMPFTVFVATDVVDSGGSAFLDWPMLRAMAGEGLASFGPHSLSHAHLESLVSADAAEQPADPREREIDGSLQRLRSELGDTVINAFAYPYGEYSQGTESILAQRGLYGLAQQSGAVGAATPLTRIPRFPLYSGADSDSRLLTALAAQPLPVIDEGEKQVFFPAPLLPPGEWRLRPGAGAFQRDAIRCYAASGDALRQRWADDQLVISLPPLQPGRNKVNCTAPALRGGGYFWYSRLWVLADSDRRGQRD
jgi:peptidoglycan/xylan/chitin deacetylase (PgdA/CDA1 family)